MMENPWGNTESQNQQKTPWWSSRVLLILLLAIGVLVGLIIFWNLMVSHTDDVDESNIPVIMAETITMKERPQTAVVEEGDSVYGLISQEKSKNSSLRTDTEEPVRETTFQNPLEQPSTDDTTSEVIDMNTEVKSQKKIKKKVVHQESINPEKTGNFFLQVGSLPSDLEAQQEIERLKKYYYKILGGLNFKIVKKEIPQKGTYYRIHVGPFITKGEASQICQNLSHKKVNCLLID